MKRYKRDSRVACVLLKNVYGGGGGLLQCHMPAELDIDWVFFQQRMEQKNVSKNF